MIIIAFWNITTNEKHLFKDHYIRWLTLGNRIKKACESTESNSGKSLKELQVEDIELVCFVFKKANPLNNGHEAVPLDRLKYLYNRITPFRVSSTERNLLGNYKIYPNTYRESVFLGKKKNTVVHREKSIKVVKMSNLLTILKVIFKTTVGNLVEKNNKTHRPCTVYFQGWEKAVCCYCGSNTSLQSYPNP